MTGVIDISDEELTKFFSANESDRLERTEDISTDKIGKTICAFANDLPDHQKPGVLIIGQRDNGKCSNLHIDDKLLSRIASIRSDGNIMPPPVMIVQQRTVLECTICIVAVSPSHSPPVRYKNTCWVRVGPSQRIASQGDENILIEKRQSGDMPFINQEVRPVIPLKELNINSFKEEYLLQAISHETLRHNQRSDEHQLKSLRFLSRDNKPNHAAVLCFHDSPHDIIPGAYIQFIRFQGDDLTDSYIMNKREINGNIFQQIRDMDDIFRANIEISAIFDNGKRQDKPNYPLMALQEILRNALVHRRYEYTNAPVKCYWFSDRIEIHSPGGPYGVITASNFANDNITDYRNPLLAEAAHVMGYAERFGSGIPKAKRAMQKNANPDIEFEPTQQSILAILKPAIQ